MSKRSRRKRLIATGVILALLAVASLLYITLSQQVNLVGILATGGEATVIVPEGFAVNIYAQGLDEPRFIQFGPLGRMFVAERGADRILLLDDQDGDGIADMQIAFAGNVGRPHSIEYHKGAWYVGVPTGVIRLEDRDGDGLADERTTLIDDYPTSGHSTRTVEFLPDGRMVVSVGSSCNVCEEEDPRRAAVVVYEGSEAGGGRIYASGLRNAVGLAVHPETGELWATNNGRDRMGDDVPPDNIFVVQEGLDYGWPACHSASILDPEFGFEGACRGIEPPIVDLQAHSAPLGLVFYAGDTFPEDYRGDLFVAYHGSWNRSVPTGYKVVRVAFGEAGSTPQVLDFATGWLMPNGGQVTGRPTGVAVGPDGALYVSDDKGGFIYRIQYVGG